jgi:monovalent cation/hydrogen antiporter
MRGVVSLAAALSIPLLINEGQPFPYRNLILVITFIVILVTLVFQGLTLPWVIRKVNPADKYTVIPVHQQEFLIQQRIAQSALQFLENKYKTELDSNEHINNLHKRLEIDLTFFNQELKDLPHSSGNKLQMYHQIYLELLEQQRKVLNACRPNYDYDEEVIRKFLSLIDIEEFRVREQIVDPD